MDQIFSRLRGEEEVIERELEKRLKRHKLYCESFHCNRQTPWICDVATDGMGNTVIESGELWDEVAGRKYHHGCPTRR